MPYDLFGHNCEHIARWCAIGNFDSHQVTIGFVLSTVGGVIATLAEGPIGFWRTLAAVLLTLISFVMFRASDRGLRAFKEHVEANGLG